MAKMEAFDILHEQRIPRLAEGHCVIPLHNVDRLVVFSKIDVGI